MTTDEQIARLTANLESLRGSVDALAGAVAAHDNKIEAHDDQIEKLILISEKNARNWENLERQWQAYLNTLPRQ
jgi:chromosome segregation ATPase